MKYEDLIEAHKNKVFQLDKAYKKLILPIKDPLENIDSIIEFVRIYNRRVPVGKNKDKIREVVISLKNEFETIKQYNLEDFEFTSRNIEIIKRVFNKLSATVLKFTGTTKLMHGMNPNLFVMWDRGICVHYGVYPNSTGYVNFMKLMQEIAKSLLKNHNKEVILKEFKRTLPKLIDEYNWIHFRTSKSV